MADATTASTSTAPARIVDKKAGPRPLTKHQQLHKLYALPVPLRTFPLPTFVPHNPLSVFHILYVWLSQVIKPESSHHDPIFQGLFSVETRSVHVTDQRSIRGLWEQGFYGKGNLSRSEPSWLAREKTRRGTRAKKTSEEVTRQRRAERQQTKWERARKEREAIDQKLLEEAEVALVEQIPQDEVPESPQIIEQSLAVMLETLPLVSQLQQLQLKPPVGPLELLSLPNSTLDLEQYASGLPVVPQIETFDLDFVVRLFSAPVGPLELLALPNSHDIRSTTTPRVLPISTTSNGHPIVASPQKSDIKGLENGHTRGHETLPIASLKIEDSDIVGGSETNDDTVDDTAEGSTHSEDTAETSITVPNGPPLANGLLLSPGMKRRKSVRFSPTVEKNTFIQTEPPSPEHGSRTVEVEEAPLVIRDQEHTQLTLEEAFFLSYGLGALEILDPETKTPIPNQDLFTLFRKTSYFPPTVNQSLSPDDPFLVNYVVYHHFRSLGWVPRSGVKFSVDLMLYIKGPVFTHAEFAVLILPSYSHPYWRSNAFLENYVKAKEQKTWVTISCINRVITQVKKTLILTYVDIPPPVNQVEEEKMGIDGILSRYKVKEIVLKRWIANRSRD